MIRLRASLVFCASVFASSVWAGELPPLPDVAWPQIRTDAVDASGFAPPGWRVEQTATGDLNGDRLADLAVILKMTNPANILIKTSGLGQDRVDTNPRLLIVAFGKAGGGFVLAFANHTLIPRLDDPVAADLIDDNALAIEGGRLKVTLTWFEEFGSWNHSAYSYAFRYHLGRFELAAYDSFTEARGSGLISGLSVNYVRRKVVRAWGEADRDEMTYRRIPGPRGSAPSLEEVGNGLAFAPDLPGRAR